MGTQPLDQYNERIVPYITYEAKATDVQTVLAANLRRLRIARHISLSELARTTAMSKATLSGIEHGRGNPTVDTLASLANALRISIAELIGEAPAGPIHIVRGPQTDTPLDGQLLLRALETSRLSGEVEVFELDLPGGQVHEVQAQPDRSRRQVLVLQGKLILGPAERISELAVGDYVSFPADVPHLYEAAHGRARALVLAYTPT
jgi:transcriptional regulator with XRE-family HTH domain